MPPPASPGLASLNKYDRHFGEWPFYFQGRPVSSDALRRASCALRPQWLIRGQSIRGNTRRRIFLVAEPDSRATAARISGSGRSKAKLRMPKPLGA